MTESQNTSFQNTISRHSECDAGCVQALVPLKDLVQAKTRLAGLLSASERRALAQAMAEDVLATLQAHPQVAITTLVSDDPGASLLAERYGAEYWPERRLNAQTKSQHARACSGLNRLVDVASDALLAATPLPLMVLHADLPCLGEDDLTAVIERVSSSLVIGSDRLGRGTNVLAFSRSHRPEFAFGADSCAAHRAWAVGAGIDYAILSRPGIGLDIDEPQDLARLLGSLDQHPQTQTAALLNEASMRQRIEYALQSMMLSETTGAEAAGDFA